NPEAKPARADGTAPGRVWESKLPPTQNITIIEYRRKARKNIKFLPSLPFVCFGLFGLSGKAPKKRAKSIGSYL
ncbi:hypothetical protein AALI21_05860, partial [Corynebacteriaceae bacterium 6-324]